MQHVAFFISASDLVLLLLDVRVVGDRVVAIVVLGLRAAQPEIRHRIATWRSRGMVSGTVRAGARWFLIRSATLAALLASSFVWTSAHAEPRRAI